MQSPKRREVFYCYGQICLTLLFRTDHALSTASCAAPQAVLELCSGLKSGLLHVDKQFLSDIAKSLLRATIDNILIFMNQYLIHLKM